MVTKSHLAIVTLICLLLQFATGQDYDITQPSGLSRVGTNLPVANQIMNDVVYTEYNDTKFSFWGGSNLIRVRHENYKSGVEISANRETIDTTNTAQIISVYVDSTSGMGFYCTSTYVAVFDAFGVAPVQVTQVPDKVEVSSPIVKCTYDMKGNLWAALEEGVLVIEDIFGAASPQAINVEFGASGIGTIVLDITHDLILLGGDEGSIWKTPTTNTRLITLFFERKAVGFGKVLCSVFDPTRARVLMGTDIGLIFEISPVDYVFTRFSFIPRTKLTAASIDNGHDVSFWAATFNDPAKATDRAMIVRVNLRNLQPFSSVQVLSGTNFIYPDIKALAAIPNTDAYLMSGRSVLSTQNYLVIVVHSKCTAVAPEYFSCSACTQQDPEYCGFCWSILRCRTQFESEYCQDWRGAGVHDIRQCIASAEVRPNPVDYQPLLNRTISVGGNYVTFNGSFPISSLDSANTFCRYIGDATRFGNVVSLTADQLVCRLPPNGFTTMTTSVKVWSVALYNLDTFSAFDTTAYVDVINCNVNNVDCNTCLSLHPSCGWCPTVGACRFSGNCTTSTRICPAVNSFSPAASSIRTSSRVTFNVQPDLTGSEIIECDFNLTTIGRVPATITPPNQVSCLSPQMSQATFDTERNGAIDKNAPITLYYEGVPFATSNTSFMLYDCSTVNQYCVACSEASRPECVFCSAGESSTCNYKNTTTCTTVSVCPVVSAVYPPSTHIDDVAGTPTVALSGNFLIDSTPFSSLVCAWNADGLSTASITTSATYSSVTKNVTCALPNSLTIGTHSLSVWKDASVRLTPDITYVVYDCSGAACNTCVDEELRPKCRWCSSESNGIGCKLFSIACSASVSNIESCPILLTASPNRDEVAGGQNVGLNGPLSLSTFANLQVSSVTCSFTLPDNSVVVTQATFVDIARNNVFCISPPSPVTGTGSVLVQIFGAAYTNPIPFYYYRCSASSTCDTCLTNEKPRCGWCAQSCALDCNPTGFPALTSCPVLERSRPTGGELEGGDLVTIYGGPFFSNNIAFLSCAFGPVHQPVVTVEETFVQCYTPNTTRNTPGTVELRVLLNNADYTRSSLNFSFFGCTPTAISQCGDGCMSQTGCGWCVGDQTCVGEARCSSRGIFLDSCLSLTVSPTFVSLSGTEPITVSFDRPLEILDILQPNTTQARRSVLQSTIDSPFFCQFGTASVPAYALVGSNNSITCTPPQVDVDGAVPLTIIYRSTILAGPIDFQFLDCGRETDCDRCQQKNLCNWCFADNKCTSANECAADSWGNGDCSVVASTDPGLIAGVVIAAAVIAGGAIFLAIFLIRRRRRRQGVIVTIVEPDYVEVAFKTDNKEQFKEGDYNKLLEDILLNKDRTFLSTLFDITNPTEQDSVARAVIFLAQSRGISSEVLQYFCQTEIINSGSENTIFRQNSMASKMFKFYSKVVGTKYLYFTMATVINELSTFSRPGVTVNGETVAVAEDPENGASLLNIEMELDPNKLSNPDADTESNAIQLALACQKILSAIIKNEQNVPSEFRDLFVRMESAIKMRFGSEDAVYKAVGGFLFLRFICPAITAPQYYGLLQQNPNEVVQRQLVLIAKVLQNLANMASVNTKEQYMEKVADFVDRNIPKIKSFYTSLLDPERVHTAHMHMELEVPENVKVNALGYMQQHITRSEKRLRKAFNEFEEADTGAAMNELLDKLLTEDAKSGKLSRANSKASKKDRESLIVAEDD
jgi:hypothetical protein